MQTDSQITPELSNSHAPLPRTPMIVQYLQLKKQYPDAILFYRMGDFYEMFFEDAVKAAPLLEVQLTSRDKNAENPIPMCGVPYHAVSTYLQKLVGKGLKVAICEQMEDPSSTKGLVRRDVVRVVTPALVPDPELVSEEHANLLATVSEKANAASLRVCLLDLLKGQARLGTVEGLTALADLFAQNPPKEILTTTEALASPWLRGIRSLFPSILITTRDAYFAAQGSRDNCLEAARSYLSETQKQSKLPHLENPLPLFATKTMALDMTSLAALEILKNQSRPEDGPTLFSVLNQTSTPMGRRTLREWLAQPLADSKKIELRHEAVSDFLARPQTCLTLQGLFSQVRDLERLTTKAVLGLAMPRDLVVIREILKIIPEIKQLLKEFSSPLLMQHAHALDPLKDLTEGLEKSLEDLPPATLRDGGIFKSTYHPQIHEYRILSRDAKSTIASIEAREKSRTGIASLKVRYNKVFGYTIEVTKHHLQKIPPDYIRKQTLSQGERYITEELKSFEEKVLSAESRLKALEESLFLELRARVGASSSELFTNARTLAEVDVLVSFSEVARSRGYVRPRMHAGWDLEVTEARHPVVETLLPPGEFVPNSVSFTEEGCRTLVITGPNMGGKSTIMRQVALLSVMAQAGSFVSAAGARLPVLDALFTRIGSSDDLSAGRSTFMVEMTEMAGILEKATAQSLILIDEIGRGTSTYDGLSLAWSLLEYLHQKVGAKTLFATHFHELTSIEKALPGLSNASVLAEKWKGEIVFLHRLVAGICNRSYGIEVAKLAGLPIPVVHRARQILDTLESQSQRALRSRSHALEAEDKQLLFFEESQSTDTSSGIADP